MDDRGKSEESKRVRRALDETSEGIAAMFERGPVFRLFLLAWCVRMTPGLRELCEPARGQA